MADSQFKRASRRLGGRARARCRNIALAMAIIVVQPAISDLAHAAALQVSPIRLDLSADEPAAALTLRNDGTAPLNAQVRVFSWTQSLDEDHLERTSVIVASPPIVQIAPGGEQVVRILRIGSAPLTREETYRLLIDEIPTQQSASETGIRMQLRYSVPVFAGARNVRAPALTISLEHGPDGAIKLLASNATDTHAQLSRVTLEWADGQTTRVSAGLLGYALPHSSRRWTVRSAPAGATSATLHAIVNGEPLTARVLMQGASADRPGATSTLPGH